MLLVDPNAESQLKLLTERFVEDAGFANRPGEKARPDATCWAILALRAAGRNSDVIPKARRWLAASQERDGRVCVAPRQPDACWPTPLAVLAWLGAPEYEESRKRALRFLLKVEPIRLIKDDETGPGHDTMIPGWPWIAQTHPWVEPTAYVLMALRASGCLVHARTNDATRLLLDRQLPSGGWNYGNTFTFQKEMRPMPECTGVALAALEGLTPRANVAKSIAYLKSQLPSLNTPMSLAWTIMGFHAWREPLDRPREQILRVLARQEELGPCDTVSLSLSLLAYHGDAGLMHFLEAS